MDLSLIPKEIQHHFKSDKIKFSVSIFEQYLLNDLYSYDNEQLKKLNRDVTQDLINEIEKYIKDKRNIRYCCLGETRSGKSLGMLALILYVYNLNNKDFSKDINYIVCGSQVEYREKLKDAKFGDFFLIDENFFTRSGLGANIEATQLKDYNNTIAKKNIHNIFITPETFLDVGAVLGFSTYGRDSENWLSRFLLYKFKGIHPHLVGYFVLDVSRLFLKFKCYIFKHIGGCNNNNKVKIKDIPQDLVKYSDCISKDINFNALEKNNVCPFYDICKHPIRDYEKKKDSWIKKSMSGTMDNRTLERFKLSLHLTQTLIMDYNEEYKMFKYSVRNAKELKNVVKLRIHNYTNTKLGIAETEEIIEIIKSNVRLDFLVENLKNVNDKQLIEQYFNLKDYGDIIKQYYNKTYKDVNTSN